MKNPLALIIMDGYGLREETEGNAIKAANTPNLSAIFEKCPSAKLACSGLALSLIHI